MLKMTIMSFYWRTPVRCERPLRHALSGSQDKLRGFFAGLRV